MVEGLKCFLNAQISEKLLHNKTRTLMNFVFLLALMKIHFQIWRKILKIRHLLIIISSSFSSSSIYFCCKLFVTFLALFVDIFIESTNNLDGKLFHFKIHFDGLRNSAAL